MSAPKSVEPVCHFPRSPSVQSRFRLLTLLCPSFSARLQPPVAACPPLAMSSLVGRSGAEDRSFETFAARERENSSADQLLPSFAASCSSSPRLTTTTTTTTTSYTMYDALECTQSSVAHESNLVVRGPSSLDSYPPRRSGLRYRFSLKKSSPPIRRDPYAYDDFCSAIGELLCPAVLGKVQRIVCPGSDFIARRHVRPTRRSSQAGSAGVQEQAGAVRSAESPSVRARRGTIVSPLLALVCCLFQRRPTTTINEQTQATEQASVGQQRTNTR